MIDAVDIVLKFRSHSAVSRPRAIAIQPGRMYLVEGPNGVGKSSFLDALSGVRAPDSGVVKWHDEVIGETGGVGLRLPQLAARGVGRMFQRTRWFRGRSVQEHLDSVIDGRAPPKDVGELLRAVGLVGNERKVSSGQARLVNLALAMATGTRVCLLDEPLAGLDVEVTARVIAVLEQAVDRGVAIVLTEHQAQTSRLSSPTHILIHDANQT